MKHITKLLTIALWLLATMSYAQRGYFYSADLFSGGLINSICQDKYGYMWIGTDYGLNKFDGYRFTTYLHQERGDSTVENNMVVKLHCDSKGQLWIGTNRGLDRFDYASETFVHYSFGDTIRPRITDISELSDGRLLICTAGYGLYELMEDGKLQRLVARYASADVDNFYQQLMQDSRGRIWTRGVNNRVTMTDTNGKQHVYNSTYGNIEGLVEWGDEVLIICMRGIVCYRNGQFMDPDFDLSALQKGDDVIWRAYNDSHGTLYIGTRGDGLFRLPTGSRRIERVECVSKDIDLNTAKVWAIAEDRHGNLWLGCQSKGLMMLPANKPQFQSWSFSAQGINISSTITSVCEGDGGITWCTVQGNGVFGFDARGRVVARPACPPSAEFIFHDRRGSYWIGTNDGLYAYNPLSGQSQRVVTYDCDKFNDMTDDGQGNIYISTFSRGFCIYNTVSGKLRSFTQHDAETPRGRLCNDWVMAMMPDSDGHIWLATSSGVSCYDPHTDSFRSLGWEVLLEGTMCYSLCETKDKQILIGTEHGLFIYKKGEKSARPFSHVMKLDPADDALRGKVIGYIVRANNGDIWCSTPMGIWQFDMRKKKYIGHIIGNGLTTKEYMNGVGLHTDNDQVYFATADGLTVFRPANVKGTHTKLNDVFLTTFLVAGHPVNTLTESKGAAVVKGPVIESNHFRLSYLDNSITLEFSLLDYNTPHNIVFEYRIGNDNWIQTHEGENAIHLNHLQPGTYKIEVRALSAGITSPSKTITVEVTPPWYNTTLARICYFLLFFAALAWVAWTLRRRATRQLNEEKMKFLINATHDIRSPLTLIMNPLSNLKRHLTSDQHDAQRDVETIEHNAKRILNLVNQILDARKIDKQQMKLLCQPTEMVGFTRGICKMFEYNAQERNMTFNFEHDGIEQLEAWVDRTQFDKVISNLLSNAFKYSADGGEVTVRLSTTAADNSAGERLCLQVIDNGIGIDSENLKHVFDRFYQGNNARRMQIEGTGIGLNLCKMIVTMHHGTIEAANRTDSPGTVFSVYVPLGNSHLNEDEMDNTPDTPVHAEAVTVAAAPVGKKGSGSGHRVLIVDDDIEIGQYISAELGRTYRFTLCPNGKEGLKELLTGGDYDLVISDVMMPEMDGFSMLRMIKSNANIAHIPVVMLTSKADVANRLEGLEHGADAFMAKPFNLEELRLVIDNLIQSRQRLKGKYSGAQQQADKVEMPEVKGNDELLMERIMKAVNKNLADSDFNVEMLTQEVGISRAQLHRKMKEMTGISTSEFIRNIRLEQAARLLREQKINVTQVAYTVGFSNLAHFSTIFRKHFGVSPSEYAEKED